MADTLFLPTFYQNRNYNRNWQTRLFFAENRFAIHLNRKTPKLKVAETVAEINFHWHFNGKQSIFWLPNYLFYNRKVLSGFLFYNRKTEISSYFGPGRTLLFSVGPRNRVWVERPELDFFASPQVRVWFETGLLRKITNDKSKFSREFAQTFYSTSTPKYFLFDLNDETPISSRVTPMKIYIFLKNFFELRNFRVWKASKWELPYLFHVVSRIIPTFRMILSYQKTSFFSFSRQKGSRVLFRVLFAFETFMKFF